MRDLVLSIIKYILLAAFAGAIFHFALAAQKETRRLWREERQLKIQIATLRKENEHRLQILDALKTDPFYVERLLRERYGYRSADEEEHVNIIKIARKPQVQTKAKVTPPPPKKSTAAPTRTRRRS